MTDVSSPPFQLKMVIAMEYLTLVIGVFITLIQDASKKEIPLIQQST